MLHDPFPDHGDDGQQPDGPVPPAAAGSGPQDPGQWLGDDGDAGEPCEPPQDAEQGLFVCLPAEELSLEGFAQDGRADTMAPGPLLATLLEAVAGEGGSGLAGLGDDQLMGVLSGTRRMEARIAWLQLAALAELARRARPGRGRPAGAGSASSPPMRWPPSSG
jgi:hypothetical protein